MAALLLLQRESPNSRNRLKLRETFKVVGLEVVGLSVFLTGVRCLLVFCAVGVDGGVYSIGSSSKGSSAELLGFNAFKRFVKKDGII